MVTRHISPPFAPRMWNVHKTTLNDGDRTNNSEGWNNRFKHLKVGHDHPSPWTVIEALQADTAETHINILKHSVGTLRLGKVSKNDVKLQKRLKALCKDYISKSRPIDDFLISVPQNIRIQIG